MYGAILGDIIGSRFEFDRGGKTKEFELFTKNDHITDDTVMTVAVADALIYSGPDATIPEIKKNVIASMRHWAKKYPNAGYGRSFYDWLFHQKNPKPYGSYGNGSAMRVSAAGWLYDTLERTIDVAKATAEVTHNHKEGIKGATCTAAVIFLARTGKSKEEIKEYVDKHYNYDLTETLDQMRNRHEHVETCQDSLPKALKSFFEGDSYEDVVRNAVSLGGDTDTLAAIAGAMAEAYYGITIGTITDGAAFIPKDMFKVIERFTSITNHVEKTSNVYENNKYIKLAVDDIHNNPTEDNYLLLLNVLLRRIEENGVVQAPMIDVNHVYDNFDINNLKIGDTVTMEQEAHFKFDTMQDGDGKHWIPLFTDEEEIHKGQTTNILFETEIEFLLGCAVEDPEVDGLVINPFGDPLAIPKDVVKIVLDNVDHTDGTNGQ